MIISSADQKQYPRLTRYARERMPLLVGDELIAKEISELTGLALKQVTAALQWGAPPTVLVVEELFRTDGAAGMFRNAKPSQIEIDQDCVKRYEANEEETDVFGASPRRTQKNTIPYAGVILLHELVHWGDFKSNGRHTNPGGGYHDLGSQWEVIAFAVASDGLTHRRDVH